MADKKVKIQIDTAANTKGANDASKALDKVSASEKEVAKSADLADNTIAGMRAEVTRLTTELENTNVGSQEFIQKATQLDAVQKRLGTTLGTSGAGFKNVGSLIGQAGFQIQDFTVQVGAGTSALTALSQQGSQLLGVFGPGGAVAGALLAIGAIAAKMFVPAEVEMNQFLTNIEEVAKLAAQGVAEDFDAILESIDRNAQKALELATLYDGVREASDRYSQSELTNAEKRREALILINQLLGNQRDILTELRDQQDAEATKRALTLQQQVAAQNEIADKAQDAVNRKNDQLLEDNLALANLRTLLALETQKLQVIRDQNAVLEAQKRNAPSFLENASDIAFPNSTIVERRVNANRASATLGSGGPELQLATQNARVEEIAQQLKDLTKSLESAQQGLLAESQRAEVITANVQTEIERLSEDSRTDELVSTVANVKSELKLVNDSNIADLQGLIEEAKPITDSQKKAVETIRLAIADGIISLQETSQISAELPILLKTLNSNNQLILTNFAIVDGNIKAFASQLVEVERRLQETARQIGKPTN
jgi:hypothetical protein